MKQVLRTWPSQIGSESDFNKLKMLFRPNRASMKPKRGNAYMVASSILGFKRKCSELEKEKIQEVKKIKIEK